MRAPAERRSAPGCARSPDDAVGCHGETRAPAERRSTRQRAALSALAALAATLAALAAAAQDPGRAEVVAVAGAKPGLALVTLTADAAPHPWLEAEALVWVSRGELLEGDALIATLRARDPEGLMEGQLGRFVLVVGALRPLHVDGAIARVALPSRASLELFGGAPVAPDWDERAFDWTAGARLSRRLGDWGSIGVAWRHQRDRGALADEELALDAGAAATAWMTLQGSLVLDLVQPGVAEAQAALFLSERAGRRRVEVFARERSASRVLPATSLFSALGAAPSRTAGVAAGWRLAPRLDAEAAAAAKVIEADAWASLSLDATLRLDPEGLSALSLGGRREGGASTAGLSPLAIEGDSTGWTGGRAALRLALSPQLGLAGELELVIPDEAPVGPRAWPWASTSVTWSFDPSWELAAALQASASPDLSHRLEALLRLTHRLGGRR